MKSRILSLVLVTFAAALGAQNPVPPESEMLDRCAALADRGQADSAAAAGRPAEALFRKRLARNRRDVDALVGLGRTLAQCLLPAASFIGQGTLSHDAMGYLEDALDLQPTNWTARFVLASIAYRSPAFLGRGDLAAKHFDELIRQQGNRALDPIYARPYEYRGRLLLRAGKPDSARMLWTRGLSLFPGDTALAGLMARTAGESRPPDAPVEMAMMRSVARADAAPVEPPAPALREVSRSTILSTPGAGADVFNAVQAQPGATLVAEGSGVFTRGGDASETVTILNGSRVLSLDRFEGLNGSMFGALEPFVVQSIRYTAGGFSVRHGNALSGIVEIETDGKPRERRSRAGLSLVQASATMWVPAGRRVGGWISGRVSQTAALLATHGREAEFEGAPHSEEMIGSVTANPSPDVELRGVIMAENDGSSRLIDAGGWRGPFHSRGNAQSLMLSSRWQPTASLTLSANTAAAARAADQRFGVLSRERGERSASVRADAVWDRERLVVRAGLDAGGRDRRERGTVPVSPSIAPGAPARSLDAAPDGTTERGGYGEIEMKHGASVAIVGLRADRLPGEARATLDPRATLMRRQGAWTGRLSAGVFHQGRWRAAATIPDAGTPSGLPGRADHLIAGVEHDAGNRALRAEIYRKRYADYRSFGAGPPAVAADVRGLDLAADDRAGRVTSSVAYSFLRARTTLADGRVTASPFDVTHTAMATSTVRLGDWSAGMTGRYGTGAPRTPVIGAIGDTAGFPHPAYGPTMSTRLPAYGRLDARVMRHVTLSKVLLTSFAEIINLTGRPNVSGLTYDAGYRRADYTRTFFSHRTIVVGAEAQFH